MRYLPTPSQRSDHSLQALVQFRCIITVAAYYAWVVLAGVQGADAGTVRRAVRARSFAADFRGAAEQPQP